MAMAWTTIPACGSAARAVHHQPQCCTQRAAGPSAPAPESRLRLPEAGAGRASNWASGTSASAWVGALAPVGVLAAAARTGRAKRRSRQPCGESIRLAAASEKKKGVPRWAPAGGNALKEQRSAVDFMNDMKEEEIDGGGRCYRVIFDEGIGIRTDKELNSDRTGEDLVAGEVFEIKREVRRGGRRFFELLDGRGWAFDWLSIGGERVELVELAAQLYTVAFPDGVNGIQWCSDTTMRFCSVQGFATETDAANLAKAGISQGDILVMVDQDPVPGMPLGQVLERVWASSGRQPGSGLYFRVITEGPYGIGIRAEPDIDGPRTGEDLIRGAVFAVDDIIEVEDGPTFLHLADNRGWVFDTRDPDNPSVENLEDVEPGCTLTMWRGTSEELAKTLGLTFKQDGDVGKPFTITVLEEGQPIQRIACPPGGNLRQTLVDNGFQVYQQLRQAFNCKANQLCGTCVLNVVNGNENLTVMSVNEKRSMAANPPGFRLCCNIDVYGDVVVQLRPQNVRYGGGTS
mmetsp:Transcript_13910/g.29090  ORF Transcript_13910/g.29090 Transcript_13910/m.29090 type:complete len:516 (+) Transcript_13910:1-1548(+)